MYNAEQVRRLDASAIEAHGIPGIELMERAGRSAFEAARRAFPQARRWQIFCGGGNNAGDGYIIARLAQEAGLSAQVCALRPPDHLSGDAAVAAQRWLQADGATQPLPPDPSDRFDLVIDALLGTGLDRAPEGDYATAIDWINKAGLPVLAVDIPSGLDADTGVVRGRAVRARATVTFIGNKRGLYTADGPDYAGAITFSDLETPETVRDAVPDSGILLHEKIIRQSLRRRHRNSHKGSFGWVLGIGGNSSMSGAVRLCGEAGLRAGAGKVTLATIPDHAALVNLTCPELMVRGVRRGKELKTLLRQVDVSVIGTGLGQTSWSEDLFKTCMRTEVPIVLDADGLNILARLYPEMGRAGDLPRGNWVLTPHPAEAGRLLGCPAREVQQDRIAAALAVAERFDATVILKGCGTVVAERSGRYAICPLGNPGMATAGTGDVLAGVVGALVAQHLDLWTAAAAAVVAHALAGDLAAREIGERGMIASDITARLPRVLNPDH
ncbi:NAD(P)H-hydrate dehydratase [Wenzhouxiangellaceae bacterium CH-27]|uniref:Bifunctional NAD(P)H-hydrate repair enzyme n=1 Tax=Elongatibacter sediminis TaxID=3119006 RepID=A0AAW9R6G8_9GAMM